MTATIPFTPAVGGRAPSSSPLRLTLARAGDNIVSATALYGGTVNLFHHTLPRVGICVRFADVSERETLYGEIPAAHRARLHRRVAEVLEELYAVDPEPHRAEVAFHRALAAAA